MNSKVSKNLKITLVLMLVGLCINTVEAKKDVPIVTKEQLKGALHNPDVIILDVRTGKNWQKSKFKIKGAKREIPSQFDSWAEKYPEDKIFVLY